MDELSWVYVLFEMDVEVIFFGDFVVNSLIEVVCFYFGFYVIVVYCLVYEFCKLGVLLIFCIFLEYVYILIGVDIYFFVCIGECFCIDYGIGMVIGEMVDIGNDVKIYQGVILGVFLVKKVLVKIKCYFIICDGVVIYVGVIIFGGDIVIGEGFIIGGNIWIINSVFVGSKVYYWVEVQLLFVVIEVGSIRVIC